MTDRAEKPPPLLRIREIRVSKLFGLYDHVVPLNQDARVTILHGPNGVGKTVLLRMVRDLLAGSLPELATIPFQSLTVTFTDGSRLEVATPDEHVPHFSIQLFDADAPQPTRRFEPLTLPLHPPSWLTELRKRISVHMIEEQRLLVVRNLEEGLVFTDEGPAFIKAVDINAKRLKKRIEHDLAHYAKRAGQLDQTFPTRLLRKTTAPLQTPPAQLKGRMSTLERRRTKLREIGLLGEQDAIPFDLQALDQLDASQQRVMELYLDDSEQKLDPLDDLARRLDLLLRIINGKFRNKSLRVDLQHGLSLRGHDGRELPLGALSSGEQHELVLLYNLLFRVRPDTLVLLDEPELSLHVTWQKRFLADLLEVVQVAGFDVLLATHSPFIVGDRSDLMVALHAEEA